MRPGVNFIIAAVVLAVAGPIVRAGEGTSARVTCDRSALLAGVRQAAAALGKDAKPGQCLKMSADDGLLLLAHRECALRYAVPGAQVQQKGAGFAPAAGLAAALDALTDRTVALEFTADSCRVVASGGTFKLAASAAPADAATFDETGAFQVKAGVLRRLARRTACAVAPTSRSPVLTGVLWEATGDTLTLVGTDGKRLAIATDRLAARGKDGAAVVPAVLMNALAAFLPADDEAVSVRFGETAVQVRCGAAVWSAIPVNGTFPKYREVVPQKADRKATMKTAAFAAALRRVTALPGDPPAYARFSLAAKELTLTATTAGVGDVETRLPVELDGAPVDLAFNPAFFLDILGVLDDDTVLLELQGPGQAGALRVPGLTYVVMPVALK